MSAPIDPEAEFFRRASAAMLAGLSDGQLKEFQEAAEWTTGSSLPDGRILGHATRSLEDPWAVQFVADRLDPAHKTILELGSCDGRNTLALAQICRQVVGLEVRPRNVVASLIRLCLHGISNAQVLVGDVQRLSPELGSFDILYHTGVLYHLSNPARHLREVAPLAPTLFLGTHVASPSAPPGPSVEIEVEGRTLEGYLRPEYGWKDPLSGLDETSCWLPRGTLIQLLFEVGFRSVEIVNETICNEQPWVYLLAQR